MQLNPNEFVISLVQHGLGDEIARLPAALSFFSQGYRPYIIVRSSLLPIVSRLFPKGHCITAAEYEAKYKHLPGIQPPDKDYPTSLNMHLVDHGFITLADRLPKDDWERSYPRVAEHNKESKLIAIQADATAPNRTIPATLIDQISEYLTSIGYTAVYLGTSTDIPLDTRLGRDERGKMTLKQTFDQITQCKMLIGIDGGLIHLAALTNMRIVAGYTSVSKYLRMPYRNGCLGFNVATPDPTEELACRPCQNKQIYNWKVDYRHCSNENQDYKCISSLPFSAWKVEIDRALTEV